MRSISFSLTTPQVRVRLKTVTRRTGWRFLRPGDLLQPVVKAQGIKRGAHVEKIGNPIRVVSVRRERLDAMLEDPDYGRDEVAREGFAGDPEKGTPEGFVDFFADSHRCRPQDEITRIEFEYM